MSWIEQIRANIRHPAGHDPNERSVETNWSAVEQLAGHKLPDDFKIFDAQFGPGTFGDFLYFFSPNSTNEAYDYEWAIQNIGQSYRLQKTDYPAEFPLPLLPTEGSFLPFGITDNGDWLGWIVTGQPSQWCVSIIGNDVGVPEPTGLTFSAFVLALINGDLAPKCFPKSVQNKQMGFEPLGSPEVAG